MIAPSTNLTRDEWCQLGIGALGAAFGAIVTGFISWGFEEAKRRVAERREAAREAAEEKQP